MQHRNIGYETTKHLKKKQQQWTMNGLGTKKGGSTRISHVAKRSERMREK